MIRVFSAVMVACGLLCNVSCGPRERKISDYFPVVLDQKVKLVALPKPAGDGDSMLTIEFVSMKKGEGRVEIHMIETARWAGEDSTTIRQFEIDDKSLVETGSQTTFKGKKTFVTEKSVKFLLPDTSGKAKWENGRGDNVVRSSSSFGPVQTARKTYKDCLIVEEKLGDPAAFGWRDYYAKGLGLVRVESLDKEGKVMDSGINMERVEP